MLWIHLFGAKFFQRSCQAHMAVAFGICSFLFFEIGALFTHCLLFILRNFSKGICSAYENTSARAFVRLRSTSSSPADFLQAPTLVLSSMSLTRLPRGGNSNMRTPRLHRQYWIQAVLGALGIWIKGHPLGDWMQALAVFLRLHFHHYAIFSTPFYEYIRAGHWVGNKHWFNNKVIHFNLDFFPRKINK